MDDHSKPAAGAVCRPGDSEAKLRSFFEEALEAVYSYLYRRCGHDASTAEDLTQETFVAAVRTLRDGRVPHLTVGWMVTTARSRFVDHCRRESRRARHLRLVPREDSEVFDDQWVAAETATEMLAELPPLQRLHLVLHHLDGLPISEVATITGKSVRAVESSLARARRALRAQLEGEADG